MSKAEESSSAKARGIRWWPAILIVIAVGGWVIHLWLRDSPRQYKVMQTAGVFLVAVVLLLAWLLLFSRLRPRVRFLSLVGILSAIVLAKLAFRFEGVTGDLVPIFTPRWQARSRSAGTAATGLPTPTPLHSDAAAGPAFPQFLGPTRDGVVTQVHLAQNWAAQPPVLLWRQPVGQGWGGFAIVDGRALTQEQDGAHELVSCYDLASGQPLWIHRDEARYDSPIGGVGPRATPTVQEGRVYALGATGILNCLDLATGGVVWSVPTAGAATMGDLEWGISSSPLVFSNLIVVAPRGTSIASLAAYRRETGERVWSEGRAQPHYSSPRLDLILGVPQLLTFTESTVASHEPGTGHLLWQYSWRIGHPHVTDPRVVGTNRVLISSGYGTGSQMVEITRGTNGSWAATNVVWKSSRLKSKFANILIQGDQAYGLDDGRLVCLNLQDGTRLWEGERFGHGQLLLVGEEILLTSESGEVVLVAAKPSAYVELTRFRVLEGKTWNPPALAGDLLLVRNDREAAAYRLPIVR